MAVDPDLVPLLQLIEAGTPIHTLTPAEARASFRKLAVDSRPPGSMAEVASVEDASVAGAEGPLPARVFRPLGAEGPVPTVVLLHGGGFVIGDLDTIRRTLPAVGYTWTRRGIRRGIRRCIGHGVPEAAMPPRSRASTSPTTTRSAWIRAARISPTTTSPPMTRRISATFSPPSTG